LLARAVFLGPAGPHGSSRPPALPTSP